MRVSGLERFTTEISIGRGSYCAGTSLRMTLATYSVVNAEKFTAITAVEFALMVLAISRKTPGAVLCRLTVVIFTSSGGLSSAVTPASISARSSCLPSTNAGDIVISIDTVA